MVSSISIALTGLSAAAKKLNASAANIANLQTVGSLAKDSETPPYTPLTTQNTTLAGGGVTTDYVAKQNPFAEAYAPDSAFADENGIIGVPNVNLVEEIVNVNLAKLQYKANVATLKTAEDLSDELFKIFDKKV